MGGYGSTRWAYHTKKETTEDCLTLSVTELKRDGLLEPTSERAGRWVWSNPFTKLVRADVQYKISMGGKLPRLHLTYDVRNRWRDKTYHLDYSILLKKTPCHFGGYRWWFVCPLSVNGRHCGRRVGKLYMPLGKKYFGCRHCYDLTYRSSQESDSQVNALKKLGTMTILQKMHSGEIDSVKGLKALPDFIWRR